MLLTPRTISTGIHMLLERPRRQAGKETVEIILLRLIERFALDMGDWDGDGAHTQ